jgi:hypothetical protein
MAKQVTVPNIPSLQGEPMDILSSPEKGNDCGATVSETEGLVTDNFEGSEKIKRILRR